MKTHTFSFSQRTQSARRTMSPPSSPRATGSPRRSFNIPKSTLHEKEKKQFQNYISTNERMLSYLEELIHNYKTAENDPKTQTKILNDFQKLNYDFSQQLSLRAEQLDSLEKQNMIFQRCEKRTNTTPKYHWPVVQKRLPSPTMPPEKQRMHHRSKFLEDIENEDLINLVQFQERQIILAKQRIKLWHDYRELGLLNHYLNHFGDFESQPNMDNYFQKERLDYLQERINREKQRIQDIDETESVENAAARSIQSAFRGHLVRQQKEIPIPEMKQYDENDYEPESPPMTPFSPRSPRPRNSHSQRKK